LILPTRRSWIHRIVCLWLLLLVSTGTSLAQGLERGTKTYTFPPGSMPGWTVPVLRLVSATHVEPTTGVILSDTGLVLVPEDFANMGDEIIVLDGGTDIIRNGRPARIEKRFTIEGLQVLSVQGLKREGVTLAATALKEGDTILLTAFPPAELIAEGEPPLSIPGSVEVFSENGKPVVSREAQLPNVTGALVDSCGNLVGVSIADEVQSMEVSDSTRYRWRDSLLRVYEEMQIAPREFDCTDSTPELAPEPEPEPEPEPLVEEPVMEEPVPEEPALEETPVPEPEIEEEQPIEELQPEILPPIEKDAPASPLAEPETRTSGWWWLVAALVLFGLGFVVHRLRRARPGEAADGTGSDGPAPAPELEADNEESPPSAPLLDSLLLIHGVLTDGTAFEDSCVVSKNAINITIGRGDADLTIDSPAVSRQQVSLNGTAKELTVADLGSSNGTSINGIPCLEGEIMFIEPGDILILGDARCTLEIRPRPAAGSEEA